MISTNAVDALTDFVDTIGGHDRRAALPALARCEVLVVTGDADQVIPAAHSEVIAAELPDAELVTLPGAGHLPMLEQPAVVDEALVGLLRRAARRRRPGAEARMSVRFDIELELPLPADTEALGERLAAGLRAGDLVVLAGPLGAGKTVLVRGLARGLGVSGHVTSPTFVIAREHRPLPGGAGVPLVHVDAYRLGSGGAEVTAELDDLDLDTELDRGRRRRGVGRGGGRAARGRHLLVRLDRRPDDVRVAVVRRPAAYLRLAAATPGVDYPPPGALRDALHPATGRARPATALPPPTRPAGLAARAPRVHPRQRCCARRRRPTTTRVAAYREFWAAATHTDPQAEPHARRPARGGLRARLLSSTAWPAAGTRSSCAATACSTSSTAACGAATCPDQAAPGGVPGRMAAVGVDDPAGVFVGDRPTTTSAAPRRRHARGAGATQPDPGRAAGARRRRARRA